MADGSPLRIPVHVVAGSRPGPRLTVISAQHGYEISEIEVCRRVVESVEPKALKGMLVVVPVANPIAFEGGTRCSWIDSLFGDNGNMNRVWPGRADGWITDRMAHALYNQVVRGSDAVLDLHDGDTAPPGLTICYGYCVRTENPGMTQRLREMALASGFDILIDDPVKPGGTTLDHFVINQGTPCFACEVGEFYGFQLGEQDQPSAKPLRTIPESGFTAVFNIMKHLGMLEGDPVLPKRQVIVSPEHNLRPRQGGLLYSRFDGRAIGRVIPKGTLMGTVISPYTFDVLDEIRAPYAQNLILATTYRHPCARVNPGNYGYIVADMSTAEWVNR
jgi:hypothetical protein